MARMTTIDAKENFADLINHLLQNKDRVVLTRRGKDVAALVTMEDFALLQLNQDKIDLNDALDSLKEVRANGAISLERIKEEIG